MLLLKGFALMCAVKTRTVQLYHRFLLPINALIMIKASRSELESNWRRSKLRLTSCFVNQPIRMDLDRGTPEQERITYQLLQMLYIIYVMYSMYLNTVRTRLLDTVKVSVRSLKSECHICEVLHSLPLNVYMCVCCLVCLLAIYVC